MLAEAKSRKESSIAKAIEKAIFSKTHDLEFKLEKYAEEKKVIAEVISFAFVITHLDSSESV